ncbi:hypothetical protein [Desulfovibrio sp. ZJ369]|uniref:hypothetical protein n=1 Tax=Desulfovibrio sp. ZJ369 TaxID=2709793 RepID=UPI0013ED5C4E|nr:hypothetical protein [Desulfovibrio sp. ZJ369]
MSNTLSLRGASALVENFPPLLAQKTCIGSLQKKRFFCKNLSPALDAPTGSLILLLARRTLPALERFAVENGNRSGGRGADARAE